MNNSLVPERHLGQAVTLGLSAIDSALRGERDPKGERQRHMISILLVAYGHVATWKEDPES